ncbi:hypothetical protein LJC19_06135 [Oxalobacter sp. OttesenSCG-928-P03]|nr:hypothetical protein [Oxalobacter sp. OttesenSCG-928-P03]
MKKTIASIAAIALLAGCAVFKTVSDYTPDPENIPAIQANVAIPVNVGEFTDASFRKELTCRSLAIVEAPDEWTYADVIRYALIDELTQAERFDTESPVTITALLNRIDFETEKGSWIIRMTLTSSNGKSMTIEEVHAYSATGIGEAACVQAVSHYRHVLAKFMKNLLASPEFAGLTKDTPPPATPDNGINTSRILDTEEEMEAAEAQAREAGGERIRQTDSLEPTRKTSPGML